MESSELRARTSPNHRSSQSQGSQDISQLKEHPGGKIKYSRPIQVVRFLAVVFWWTLCTFAIWTTQIVGLPLYFINRDYHYAYVALTKQQYGIFVTTLTAWFSPTPVWVSGDESVRDQLKTSSDGGLITDFPERMVLIANHQLYTDWLYLWWIAYTSRMHGHIYIVLKESLKYVPIIGPAMMIFGFIFMSRKWVYDKDRIRYRLQKLTTRHKGPLSGSQDLDPMWFLIFPEGTNVSANTRKGSAKWAEKQGIKDMKWQVLPRSTGLQFCLSELKGTLDWVYDVTVGYEGIPRGGYGQDYFGLLSTYIQGRPPKSVHMYWRRFSVASMPIDDPRAFEQWVLDRWREKDDLLDYYADHGRFPPTQDTDSKASGISSSSTAISDKRGYIITEVKLAHWLEVGKMFVVAAAVGLVANVIYKILTMFTRSGL